MSTGEILMVFLLVFVFLEMMFQFTILARIINESDESSMTVVCLCLKELVWPSLMEESCPFSSQSSITVTADEELIIESYYTEHVRVDYPLKQSVYKLIQNHLYPDILGTQNHCDS